MLTNESMMQIRCLLEILLPNYYENDNKFVWF